MRFTDGVEDDVLFCNSMELAARWCWGLTLGKRHHQRYVQQFVGCMGVAPHQAIIKKTKQDFKGYHTINLHTALKR